MRIRIRNPDWTLNISINHKTSIEGLSCKDKLELEQKINYYDDFLPAENIVTFVRKTNL